MMGFTKVYKSLQEIFPQIDARVLRAVAIEHSKDADAAVEAVLVEIIPFFTERSRPSTPSTGSTGVGESAAVVTATAQDAESTSVNAAAGSTAAQNGYIMNAGYQAAAGSTAAQNGFIVNAGNQQSFGDANDVHTEPLEDAHIGHHKGKGAITESTSSGSIREADHLTDTDGVNALQLEVSVEQKTDQTTSDGKYPESSIRLASDASCHTLGDSQERDAGINQDVSISRERAGSSCLETEFDTATNNDCDREKSSEDVETGEVGRASFIVNDLPASLPENNLLVVSLDEKSPQYLDELDASLPRESAFIVESTSNVVESNDESTLNGSVSQSSKIHMIDAFSNIIVDARNNKKMFFSAMDSVIHLMKELELKEKAAEQAKVEAAMGGTDILVKCEELKKMVKLAEEANSMHAGEVYGEKAILATELRELQSRAFSFSVERDKFLAVLDEMQQTLKVRLADAQNVIESAELQKTEKENAAMEALSEQKLIMEKVLEESKILNQQAEDNAKLREFLMDRGHVVDTLQGEISVICHDVRMLKETFDKQIPFSKSLSSSQTSCILASSGSSSKSSIREQVESLPDEEVESLKAQDKKGAISSPSENSSQDEAARNDHKALSDEDWEIFDRDMQFE